MKDFNLYARKILSFRISIVTPTLYTDNFHCGHITLQAHMVAEGEERGTFAISGRGFCRDGDEQDGV